MTDGKKYSLEYLDNYGFRVVESTKGIYDSVEAALDYAVTWLEGEQKQIEQQLARAKAMLADMRADDV
jgi:hypothetical protein